MKHLYTLSFLLIFLGVNGLAQSQFDTTVIKKDIMYLASEKLAGRGTGTPGEALAAQYIANRFKKLKLKPLGDNNTFFQHFSVTGTPVVENAKLSIFDINLNYPTDFVVASESNSGKVTLNNSIWAGYGIEAPVLNYLDYKPDDTASIVWVKAGNPDQNPHGKFTGFDGINEKIKNAKAHGAKLLLVYSADSTWEPPKLERNATPANTLVVYLTASGWDKVKKFQNRKDCNISVSINLKRPELKARNIAGFVDIGAQQTLVVGAHFDHLGHGEQGGSLYRGPKSIHNGADDNASGTAGLLALAQYYALNKPKHFNLLFLAFSGEEMGLLGSSYYTKNATIPHQQMLGMLNMDMIGRLDPTSNVLGVNGVGTAREWIQMLDTANSAPLKIKTTNSGVGSSDHTSFYLKDIPVLHFFSGTHADYHKPTDDADKINYQGEEMILNYIKNIINKIDANPKLTFTKTTDEDSRKSPRFSVTLGIIPDYLYEGEGVRVDGVTEGKPAAKAGVKTGDLLIRLGDVDVANMQTYMQALAKFKKGQSVDLVIIRDKKTQTLSVTF